MCKIYRLISIQFFIMIPGVYVEPQRSTVDGVLCLNLFVYTLFYSLDYFLVGRYNEHMCVLVVHSTMEN